MTQAEHFSRLDGSWAEIPGATRETKVFRDPGRCTREETLVLAKATECHENLRRTAKKAVAVVV